MSFDPKTIEHLGSKMYSRIPNAIAELIANAYDAEASRVDILLYDTEKGKSIKVIDDGHGMTYDEININFLRIGRNRRAGGETKTYSGKRRATGKKGLGKLALFGIGKTIKITTTSKNSERETTFTLDWDKLNNTPEGKPYKPKYEIRNCSKSKQGTTILLDDMNRVSPFNEVDLAISLSRLFNCFDNEFKCYVRLNDGKARTIDSKLRYKSIDNKQFKWIFPSFCKKVKDDYKNKNLISGKIISAGKPLKPELRGITLYANGRMVNYAEFFGVSESSHGFSYITGWLDVNFVDDYDPDVIATDRQSLNWEVAELPALRSFLQKIVRKIEVDWRKKRTKKRQEKIKKESGIDLSKWYETLPLTIRSNVETLVSHLTIDSEQPSGKEVDIVKKIHDLAPEYPNYHWRELHPEVKVASETAYQNADYYTAFNEAVKHYVNNVRNKSSSTAGSDHSMMGHVFGDKKLLSVTKNFKRPDGSNFGSSTLGNIENGQRELSQGVITGCRNPVAHEEHADLRDSGLFSEKDCLDALSLLSHLFKRLDDAG